MGVGDVPSVPSLALGSGEVTLQSMTAAYAAFANHGTRAAADAHPPRRGSATAACCSRRETSVDARHQRHDGVPDVDDAGRRDQRGHRRRARGASASRCRPRARPARPTTSTTPGSSASRRSSSTGVWVGFDQPQTILPNGFAGDVAVPIWASFMKAATHGDKPEWLTAPAGRHDGHGLPAVRASSPTEGCEDVEVVDDRRQRSSAGRWSTPNTSRRGTGPTDYCDLHPTRGFFGADRRRCSAAAKSRCRRAIAGHRPAARRPCDRRAPAGAGAARRDAAAASRRRRSAASGRASSAAATTSDKRNDRTASRPRQKAETNDRTK